VARKPNRELRPRTDVILTVDGQTERKVWSAPSPCHPGPDRAGGSGSRSKHVPVDPGYRDVRHPAADPVGRSDRRQVISGPHSSNRTHIVRQQHTRCVRDILEAGPHPSVGPTTSWPLKRYRPKRKRIGFATLGSPKAGPSGLRRPQARHPARRDRLPVVQPGRHGGRVRCRSHRPDLPGSACHRLKLGS